MESNQVLILGTGNFGKLVLHGLNANRIRVKAFIDLNPRHVGSLIYNIPVIDVADIPEDCHVVIASNMNNISFLEELLGNSKAASYDICDFIFDNFDFADIDIDWSIERCKAQIDIFLFQNTQRMETDELLATGGIKTLQITSLDIVLTEKCTLKCVDCSNLMQYYKKPKNSEYNQLEKNLKFFISSVDYIHELRLIGGEPLLYRDIDNVLKILLGYNNFGKIVIFTNGTIVPREKALSLSTDPRVNYFISDYGEELSKRSRKLVAALEDKKINYILQRITTWQDCAKISRKNRSSDKTFEVFSNCCVNNVLTLLDGKVYGCPFSAHAENLKAIPEFESDSIDLDMTDRKMFREKMVQLLSGKAYYGACLYCEGRDYTVATVQAAVQTKTVLDYELVAST